MSLPLYTIETIGKPSEYSATQIRDACFIAAVLGRGKLILLEKPHQRHGYEPPQ